jgi:hypothetical protein
MKKTAFFIVLFLILASAVWGQATFTWTGTTDDNWEDPTNWDCDDSLLDGVNYPGDDNARVGDIVKIDKSVNVSISSTITIGNITADADVVITIEDGSDVNFGNITSGANITINVEDNCNVTIGKINTDGDVKINTGTDSTVVVNEITAGGDTDIDSGVTVTITPPNTYVWNGATNSTWTTGTNWVGGKSPGNGNSAYTITIPSTTNTPSFTGASLAYNTLTIQAGASLNIGTANLPAGTLVNNGNLILAGTAAQNLNTTITANETVTFNAANAANGTRLAGLTSFKNLTIQNGTRTNAGTITVSGNFNLAVGSLSATSIDVTGTSSIAANVTTTGGMQKYEGAVTLGGNVTLLGSTVTFEEAIVGGGNSLTITGNGVLNGGSGINVLTVSGTTTINQNITTTGNQTYTGAVTLGDDLTLAAGTSTVTLGNITGATHSLTITGNSVLNGGSGIDDLFVSGTSTINGDITTTGGTQIYTGAVTLGGTGTRILTGVNVTLGTITGATRPLTIAGNGTFNGGTAINALSVTGDFNLAGGTLSAASVNVTGASNIAANVTTTGGTQNYTGAVTLGGTGTLITLTGAVTLGTTITGSGKSLTITGNGTFNSGGNGINALSVGGNFVLTGNALSAASVSVTGTSNIGKNITTTGGTQTYTGNVTLGDDLILQGSTVTLGNIIGATHSLTITGNGTLNGGSNITDLSVSKNFNLSGALTAASVNVGGTSSIGANVTTTGGIQTYTGTVTLVGTGATRTLLGSTVTLGAIIGNGNALTITGDGAFNNGGSDIGALIVSKDFNLVNGTLNAASISVTGISTVNGDINTTGAQTYNGAATLVGSTRIINSESGAISFNSTLTSSDIIELLASGGNITLGGKTTASQLIAIASGTVKVGEIKTTSTGKEGTSASIYIEANIFDASAAAANSIDPGGQLCLVLKTAWISNGAVNGPEDNPIGTVPGARWHQHVYISLAGKHLVYYGGTNPDPGDDSDITIGSIIIESPYVCISDTNPQATFVLDASYNVYIYNATNTSSLTFQTKGSGTIEFIGTNTFGKITLITATAGGIIIGSNVTGTQTYSGTVTLSDDVILTGPTVTLGAVTGAHSLAIKGNGTFGGAVNGITDLSVSLASAINADITTTGTQTYTGTVTLGGTGTRILKGMEINLRDIDGDNHSLTITGNGTFGGAVSDITNLSVSLASAINADITTTGTQTYTGAVTLGGSGTRTLQGATVTLGAITGNTHSLTITGDGVFNGGGTGINVLSVSGTATLGGTGKQTISSSGNIQFQNTLTSANEIELSAANITISGKTSAKQLIAKAPNGTVSVNEIGITTTSSGNEGENAAIYINANTFVVTTTAAGSIIPGKNTAPQWGQMCLTLQNKWLGPYEVVDGIEDTSDTPPTATGFRWHQHYPGSVPAGKILYSFTEDSNGNGRLDRIRAQTNKTLSGDFTGFSVSVVGYEIDKTKGTNNSGYAILASPNDDSFYIYLTEKDEFDGGNIPHWSITRNTSLKDNTNTPITDISQIQYIDTIPPRIAYTLTLPMYTQTYVQMSESVKPSSGSDIIASFGGASTNIIASKPNPTGYLFDHPLVLYGANVLVQLNNTTTTLVNGYFQMTNITDNGTAATPNGPAPKYPTNWGYTSYATSNVFIPPHKLLTVDMISKLANGQGSAVTPVSNFTVTRRVTDILVSMTPNAAGDNYFAWPTFVKPSGGSKSITDFDGTDYLEKDSIEKNGMDLQVRISNSLTITPITPTIFWRMDDIPADMRNPKIANQSEKIGGLWLPNVSSISPVLYYYVPLSNINPPKTGVNVPSSKLYNYNITANELANSGSNFEFILRINNSDMFVARLDSKTIPSDWYTLVRPFGFSIQGMNLQRGGVTILNNVINSDKKETALIRYDLTRSGRVTVQIYTLDGTLVKSIRRNEQRETGSYVETWDGSNNGGRAVARGMYFVRVVGPDIDEIRKIMVVK